MRSLALVLGRVLEGKVNAGKTGDPPGTGVLPGLGSGHPQGEGSSAHHARGLAGHSVRSGTGVWAGPGKPHLPMLPPRRQLHREGLWDPG